MAYATTTAEVTAAHRDMAAYELKGFRANWRRHERWLSACTAYSNGRLNALDGLRCPSKTAKYKMYASADRMIRLLVLDVPRPTDMAGLKAVIDAADVALGSK